MSGLAKIASYPALLFKSASYSNLFENRKPLDELKRKRLQKLYEEYYKQYNKLLRPIQEKKPVGKVKGLARWTERTWEDVL